MPDISDDLDEKDLFVQPEEQSRARASNSSVSVVNFRTKSSIKIIEIFQERAKAGEDRHLSAEEVYKELVNTGEDVGLATVYRVLAQFASAGILTRRNFEHGTAVFELDDGHHHDHLICVMCGKVVEFVDEEVEKRQAEVAKQHGYELVDHSMALYGVCPECQKHKAEKREI